MKRAFHRRGAIAACLLLGLAALATGCGSGGSSSGSTHSPTVTVALSSAPATLDPALITTTSEENVERALYDPLVRIDPSGKIVPALAKSWKVTPDSATFELRSGVTCSDGTALTPAMVAASINRLADPETGSVQGADVFGHGTAKATVTGSHEVTVKLSEPWADLLPGLAGTWASIVCPAGLKNLKSLTNGAAGTGPYALVSVRQGISYKLKKRPGYNWGSPDMGASPPQEIDFTVVNKPSTATNLLISGELDTATLAATDAKRMEGQSGFSAVPLTLGNFYFFFNETAGHVTANEDVRRKIAEAIDREAIMQATTAGKGTLVDSFGYPGLPCYDDSLESLIPAHQTSASLGAGTHLRVLGDTLYGPAGGEEVLSLLQAAGFDTSLKNLDDPGFIGEITSGANNWDVAFAPIVNQIDSLAPLASLFIGPAPPNGFNLGDVQNPQLEAAFAKATSTLGKAACPAWSAAQEATTKRVDLLPLTTIPGSMFLAEGVTGQAVGGTLETITLSTE